MVKITLINIKIKIFRTDARKAQNTEVESKVRYFASSTYLASCLQKRALCIVSYVYNVGIQC